jgi:hypothetical protein
MVCEPERQATAVTRVREWRSGVPVQAQEISGRRRELSIFAGLRSGESGRYPRERSCREKKILSELAHF